MSARSLERVETSPRSTSGGRREPPIVIPLGLSARLARRLVASAALACAGLLLGTAIAVRDVWGEEWEQRGPWKYLWIQLDLGSENVSASWFASMLLLMVALGAVACFLADRAVLPHERRARRALSFGWLAVAGEFAAMSLDEMGSLHERIGLAPGVFTLPLAWVDPFLPLFLPGGLTIGLFVCVHLARRPAVLGLMLLGLAALAAVPVTEHFEPLHFPDGRRAVEEPIWVVGEEGLEVFASIAFLAAVLTYVVASGRDARRLEAAGDGNPSIAVPLRTAVLAAAAAAAAAGAAFAATRILASVLPPGDNGIVDNWFASAPAAAAAVGFAILGRDPAAGTKKLRPLYLATAAYCVAVSQYFGACLGQWVSELPVTGLPRGQRLRSLGEGAMIAVALGLAWALARADRRWWGRVCVVLWGILLAIGLADSRINAGGGELAAFALLWLGLLSHWAVPVPEDGPGARSPRGAMSAA